MFTTESSKGNLLILMLLILSCESHSFMHSFQNLSFSIHVGDCWELDMYNIYIYWCEWKWGGGFAEPLQLFKLHPLRTIAIFQVATLRNHCNFSCCTHWFPINSDPPPPPPPPPPHLQKLTFFHAFEKFRHCIFLSPLKFFESCDSLRSLRSKFTGV